MESCAGTHGVVGSRGGGPARRRAAPVSIGKLIGCSNFTRRAVGGTRAIGIAKSSHSTTQNYYTTRPHVSVKLGQNDVLCSSVVADRLTV